MNSAAKRVLCCLPSTLKSLCETGCVYREPAFRHLACKYAVKTECAAPCYPEPCPCKGIPAKIPKTETQVVKYKYYHEVFTL